MRYESAIWNPTFDNKRGRKVGSLVWWPLFALALECLGGGVKRIHVAKASGTSWEVLPEDRLLRLALSRNAMRILVSFAVQTIGIACFRMTACYPQRTPEYGSGSKKMFRFAKNLTMPLHEGHVSAMCECLDIVKLKEGEARIEEFRVIMVRKALTNGCSVTQTALSSFSILLSVTVWWYLTFRRPSSGRVLGR